MAVRDGDQSQRGGSRDRGHHAGEVAHEQTVGVHGDPMQRDGMMDW
jgi:hypothetical protein